MICSTFIHSFPVFWYVLTIHCQHWIRRGLIHLKMMAGVFSEYLQEFLFRNFRILKGAVLVWYLVSDVCNYANRIHVVHPYIWLEILCIFGKDCNEVYWHIFIGLCVTVNEYFFVITVIIEITVSTAVVLIYLFLDWCLSYSLGKYLAYLINSSGNCMPFSICGSFHTWRMSFSCIP